MDGEAPPQNRDRDIGSLGRFAFNAVFWPYLALSSVALFFPALGIFLATAAFDKLRNWAGVPVPSPPGRILGRFTAEWGAHYVERAPYTEVRVTGREHVDGSRTVIYVVNHQSLADTLAIFSVRAPALWVSKVEVFYAPFLGWNMALNRFIPLRRGHLPSIMRMYRTCLRRLGEGHSLLVFPEGTRSRDGELRPFFRGAFGLATRMRVPIVPIVLEGTGNLLKKNTVGISPTDIDLSILPPIDPSVTGHDSRKLRDHVRDVMAAELERLRTRRQNGLG